MVCCTSLAYPSRRTPELLLLRISPKLTGHTEPDLPGGVRQSCRLQADLVLKTFSVNEFFKWGREGGHEEFSN